MMELFIFGLVRGLMDGFFLVLIATVTRWACLKSGGIPDWLTRARWGIALASGLAAVFQPLVGSESVDASLVFAAFPISVACIHVAHALRGGLAYP